MEDLKVHIPSGRAYSFFAFEHLLGNLTSADFPNYFQNFRLRFGDDALGRSKFIGESKKMGLFFNNGISFEYLGGVRSDKEYLTVCKSFIQLSETGYGGLGEVVDEVIAAEGYQLDKIDEALAGKIMRLKCNH